MPNGATHIIVALIVADIIRDYVVKRKFKMFYVLVAGVAGLLPDIDIIFYWFMNIFSKVPLYDVHRLFTHNLFVPLIFLGIAMLLRKKRKYFLFFSMVSLGTFTHLVLDFTLSGYIMPFYPISTYLAGLNIISGTEMGNTILLGMDAIILLAWLTHEYIKHNIRDFI